VAVPAVGPLKIALDTEWARAEAEDATAKLRRAGHVLVTSRGTPWRSGFASQFSKEKNKLGFALHHFHDLRGTAVTRLALAGCSMFEIASITGHSEKQVHAILEAHYTNGPHL
jgi:integrase